MKKAVIVVLILSAVLTLAGCASIKYDTSEEVFSSDVPTESAEPATETEEQTISTELPEETDVESIATVADTGEPQETPAEKNDRILKGVYYSERPFIYYGEEMYFKSFLGENGSYGVYSHVAVDLDSDGNNELIVQYSRAGDLLIFHAFGEEVHAYGYSGRGMSPLKADGSFGWSSAYNVSGRASLSFDINESTVIINNFIRFDEPDGIYEIDGVPCTSEEALEAISEWNEREDAQWMVYDEPFVP